MTCGCSEKFGVELTNPETRKILEILSNEPNYDFNCASAFIMHNLAAFCAFSIDCSTGTFPVKETSPLFIGIWPETYAVFLDITTGMYDPAGLGGSGNFIPISFNFSSITVNILITRL